MADEPINPVIEHLKTFQAGQDNITRILFDLTERVASVETKVAHVGVDVARIDGRLDSIERRLDRIEKRINLLFSGD